MRKKRNTKAKMSSMKHLYTCQISTNLLGKNKMDEYENQILNPAVYLAEATSNQQNEQWDLKKDLSVGPLDQQQQDAFQQLLANNVNVCASSQLDIGRTNI